MGKVTEMAAQDKWQMEAQKRQENLRRVKSLLAGNAVKERFNAILGKKSVRFCASLVNVVSGSAHLLDCDPNSVMAAAFVAATYDLPIDGNLGFSAIVPYKGKAQFQMMTKGFVQLAIRSHEYEKMNCSEVYGDELVNYNPITGECQFVTDFSQCTQRAKGKEEDIVGYYAWFRLLHGYTAELYMSKEEVVRHARKYSRAYQYDMRNGAKSSVWSTDFTAMAKKTVLKRLLNRWGILSVDIQRAIEDDQKVYGASGKGEHADNQSEVITAEDPFTPEEQGPEARKVNLRKPNTRKRRKRTKRRNCTKPGNSPRPLKPRRMILNRSRRKTNWRKSTSQICEVTEHGADGWQLLQPGNGFGLYEREPVQRYGWNLRQARL